MGALIDIAGNPIGGDTDGAKGGNALCSPRGARLPVARQGRNPKDASDVRCPATLPANEFRHAVQ